MRKAATAAIAAIVVLLSLAACSAGGTPGSARLSPVVGAAASRYFRISPAPGEQDADPSDGIAVSPASGARLADVTVTTSGNPVTGTMSASGAWHSTWALSVAQSYTVTAKGTDPQGHPVTATSSFRTLNPARVFHTEIFEGAGATYGVGMPIMLTFDQPITDKAAVERAMQITTSRPVTGAWYWDGDKRLDFRPRDYWPADTTVSFDGHLDGVDGGGGVYGMHDLTQTFRIGQSVIAVASTTSHYTHVYVGGKLKYTWPISTGAQSTATPDGTYLTVEKGNPVRMIGGTKGTPGYYDELVNYAVRFTFSGDYYHSAPWSVVNQGTDNVSHGCVNLSPADAKTYYDMAIPGDPITITSSTKAGKWDDGWTEWFLSWNQLLQGSATHLAVEAGPGGSTLVSPSSLPADQSTAPLAAPAEDNYLASS